VSRCFVRFVARFAVVLVLAQPVQGAQAVVLALFVLREYADGVTSGASRFTYVQVAESLKADIAAERLKPGDQLPSIRALASRFDISAVTAGNALGYLREQGLIRSNSTRGYFVSDGAADASQSLAEELDAVRGELRRLTERVDELEGVIRDGASLEPSTNR
jgi:DNA-binding transcriptional regulator YhcF (GntR family)